MFLTALPLLLIISCVPFLTGNVAAQAYTEPHGYLVANGQFCAICHDVHESPGGKLLQDFPESALCFTCHNGTGSIYDIQTEMNADPAVNAMHPINVNLPNNPGVYTYTISTTAGIAPPGPYDCSTCHNPHRDTGFGLLLRGSYNTSEYVPYPVSPDPFDACWSCHSKSIAGSDQGFLHGQHVQVQQSPCIACHYSPHGVANTELVNFDASFVGPSASQAAGPAFTDSGDGHGSCLLSCHGVDHNPASY